jgi:hypothetical protein
MREGDFMREHKDNSHKAKLRALSWLDILERKKEILKTIKKEPHRARVLLTEENYAFITSAAFFKDFDTISEILDIAPPNLLAELLTTGINGRSFDSAWNSAIENGQIDLINKMLEKVPPGAKAKLVASTHVYHLERAVINDHDILVSKIIDICSPEVLEVLLTENECSVWNEIIRKGKLPIFNKILEIAPPTFRKTLIEGIGIISLLQANGGGHKSMVNRILAITPSKSLSNKIRSGNWYSLYTLDAWGLEESEVSILKTLFAYYDEENLPRALRSIISDTLEF